MNQDQSNNPGEIKWEIERNQTKLRLQEKLLEVLPKSSFSFLTNELSDKIQLSQDEWPRNDLKLFRIVQINDGEIINGILQKFISLNPTPDSYIFFLNYNFGLVKLDNFILNKYWRELIAIDTDEIFCFIPEKPDFICIEKTQETTKQENVEKKWIYEITYSNQNLKNLLE